MNVLMLSEVSAASVIGGAERMLREQACGLARAGNEVRLVVRQPPGDARSEVTIGDVIERRYPVVRFGEAAFVATSLRGSLRTFDQAAAGTRLDAVIIHQSLAGLAPLLFRRGAARVWLYLCHSLAHEEYLSRLRKGGLAPGALRRGLNAAVRRWIERRVLRRCHRIVVLSDFMHQRVRTMHAVAPDRITKLPGAADLDRFHPVPDRGDLRQELKLSPKRFLIFTVRNLVPRMGLDNLLKAIRALSEDARGIEVVIGGDGPLRPSLERDIRALGLAETVRLIGFIPEELLPKYYQASDLVVVPTQELEGFGLVTVEALACGTPVLGTPVGATPEILGRLDPVLLTEGSDADCLARGIRRIVRLFRDRPHERDRLAAQGLTLVEQHYTWRGQIDELTALLRGHSSGGAP